jgi:lipopolysaccharide biosynthesis glycosyltransferase
MLAVTAIDRAYLPGLKALHNSIRRNSPNVTLGALVYGSDNLVAEVKERGIGVIANPTISAALPVSIREPVGNPAMYARLLIPGLFGVDAVWLDADQVVLRPLDPLFELDVGELPCAAVPAPSLPWSIGNCPHELVGITALYAGLVFFKSANWIEQRVTERCFEAMDNPRGMDYYFVVQSVMDYVLRGRFYHLPIEWQGFASRRGPLPRGCRVAHWHGCGKTPWTHSMEHASLWQQYA